MGGTTHINNLIGQMLTWALVLAVAAFIAYGATWAVGSLSANPQNAGRGKIGMIICLAAALVLGGGLRLVEWTYDSEARNFQADPAGYTVDDSPQGVDAFTVLDKTDIWTPQINQWRTQQGHQPVTTEPGLRELAKQCALSLAGSKGACPNQHQFKRFDYGPADLGKLSGSLDKDGVTTNMGRVMVAVTTEVAMVAATNNAKKTGTLVIMAAARPCGACAIGRDAYVEGLIISTLGKG